MHLDFTDLRKDISVNENNWIKQNDMMKYRKHTFWMILMKLVPHMRLIVQAEFYTVVSEMAR